MKKFFILFTLQLMLTAALCTASFARNVPRKSNGGTFIIMSSPYIKSYDSTIIADSNGVIALECTVLNNSNE